MNPVQPRSYKLFNLSFVPSFLIPFRDAIPDRTPQSLPVQAEIIIRDSVIRTGLIVSGDLRRERFIATS